MSVSTDYLRSSRLVEALKKVESGEPVDFGQLATLQTLDLATISQGMLADAIDQNQQADEALEALFNQQISS